MATKPGSGMQRLSERLVYLVFTAVIRRHGVLLAIPLLYILIMLAFLALCGLDGCPIHIGVAVFPRRTRTTPLPPGSLYRSPQVFHNLWPDMEADSNNLSNQLRTAGKRILNTRGFMCSNGQ